MLFTRENENKKIVWKGVKEEVENSELETPVEEEIVDEEMEIELPPEELEDLNPEENEGL